MYVFKNTHFALTYNFFHFLRRPFIGRKNWLFCNSIAGVRAAEILFSVIETCDLHGIEPYAYLKFILAEIPYAKTLEEIERLLPFNAELQKLIIDPHNTS